MATAAASSTIAAASSTAVGTAALASSTGYAPPGPYVVAASAVPVFEVSMTLGLLAVITVILRFVARHKQRQHIGGDDYAIVVAVVFMIGFLICGGLLVYNGGLGQHEWDLDEEVDDLFGNVQFAIELLYLVDMAAVKVSILLLYRRLFTPFLSIVTLVLGIIVVCWCVAGVLVTTFQCDPIAAVWDFKLDANCIDPVAFSLAIALSGVLADLIVLCLPLQMVWRLHLPTRQKLVLSMIFGLGGFVVVASIMRIVSLNNLDNDDLPYTLTGAAIWSIIEAELSITCANLPLLRPLLPGKEKLSIWRNYIKTRFGMSLSRSNHDRSASSGQSDSYDPSPAQELKPLSGNRPRSHPRIGKPQLHNAVSNSVMSVIIDEEPGSGENWLQMKS